MRESLLCLEILLRGVTHKFKKNIYPDDDVIPDYPRKINYVLPLNGTLTTIVAGILPYHTR